MYDMYVCKSLDMTSNLQSRIISKTDYLNKTMIPLKVLYFWLNTSLYQLKLIFTVTI